MKIPVGNVDRACLWGFVLSALLLVAHNGLNLTTLLEPGLSGYPADVRGIRSQWGLLEQVRSLGLVDAEAGGHVDLDRVLGKFVPDPGEKTWVPASAAASAMEVPASVAKPRARLPRLTGIVRQSDSQGRAQSFATLEGEVHVESEQVWGFTIEQISQEGVLLTKGGSRWFIPAPKPSFSVVRPEHDSSPARSAEQENGEEG